MAPLGAVAGRECVFVGIQATDFAEIAAQQRQLRESVYAVTSTNHAVASGRELDRAEEAFREFLRAQARRRAPRSPEAF